MHTHMPVHPCARMYVIAIIQATDVSWRLNLMLSQASQLKTKQINAQFEVNVATKGEKDKKVQVEFTHSELFKFYTQVRIMSPLCLTHGCVCVCV